MPLLGFSMMPRFLMPDWAIGAGLACLHLFFLFAAFFGPLLVLWYELRNVAQGKAFFDKLSLQTLQACVLAGIIAGLMFLGEMALTGMFQRFIPAEIRWTVGASTGYTALLGFFLLAHQPLRKLAPLRFFIALIIALLPLALGAVVSRPDLAGLLFSPSLWFQSMFREGWMMLNGIPAFTLHLALTGVAAAASLATLWMIIRRNRADFGRDYYAFAIKSAGRAAGWFALINTAFVAAAMGLLVKNGLVTFPLADPFEYALYAPPILLPLLAWLIWRLVSASATPMRYKPAEFLAFILLFAGFAAQMHFFMAFALRIIALFQPV